MTPMTAEERALALVLVEFEVPPEAWNDPAMIAMCERSLLYQRALLAIRLAELRAAIVEALPRPLRRLGRWLMR